RGRCGLSRVPYAVDLYRALSEVVVAHCVDRRVEACHGARRAQGRAVSAQSETKLWILQRATAALLALCVAVHLATMIVVVKGGLTAVDILGRTRGSVGWAAFYGVFVLAVAVHAPIGLRTVAGEWLQWRGRAADGACALIGVALLVLGARAIVAVTL